MPTTVPVAASAFAELLLRHRLAAGLGQRELADGCGLSERALRDLERGVRTPRRLTVRALAGALDLAGDDLAAFLAASRPAPADPDPVPAPALLHVRSGELIGRDRELRTLVDLCTGARHRLITVTGPGGVGKSRIAAELATRLARDGGRQVGTVDLSAVTEPGIVAELAADALSCGPSKLPPVDRIAAHLRGRRAVLILDRFELLLAAAPTLAVLVCRCPGLTLLVTSQRPLQLQAERLVPLGPLAPDAAIRLFAERAAAIRPGFEVTPGIADTVAAICRRVDHLPLAIELAAARVRMLQPAELAERLDRRLQVLTGGSVDLPARHRSLRATVESSLEAVTEPARTLFTWLGGCAGGARLDDLEAVAAALGRDRSWLLGALTELVDTSLVRTPADGTTTRFVLPDAMAELAAERLAGSGGAVVRRAIAVRCLDRVRQANEGSGPPMTGRDASSVRSAVAWAVTHEPALFDPACVEGVYRFFETTSRLVEGQDVLVRIADRGPAIALTRAGQLAVLRGDLHAAESMAARALRDIAPADAAGRAVTRMVLAQATTERGHPLAGRHHLRAALVDARLAGDLGLIGRVFNNLSAISVERGRLRDAERQLAAALTAKRRGGAGPVDCGRTLFNLAEIALEQGRLAAAARAAAEAAHLLRAGGYPRLAGLAATTRALALLHGSAYREALAVLAEAAPLVSGPSDDRRADTVLELRRSVVQHAAGELRSARESLRRALPRTLGLTARDRDETARALSLHAWYLAGRDPGAAARLLGAATRLGTRALPAPEAGLAERAAAAARAALGAAEFEGAHRAGAGLDRDALIALADRIAHVAR